jgi:hypothetical protein
MVINGFTKYFLSAHIAKIVVECTLVVPCVVQCRLRHEFDLLLIHLPALSQNKLDCAAVTREIA